jgi:hypothetical protein
VYEAEGLPTLSVNGHIVSFPCYTTPAGAYLATTDMRTLAVIRGNVLAVDTTNFVGGVSTYA